MNIRHKFYVCPDSAVSNRLLCKASHRPLWQIRCKPLYAHELEKQTVQKETLHLDLNTTYRNLKKYKLLIRTRKKRTAPLTMRPWVIGHFRSLRHVYGTIFHSPSSRHLPFESLKIVWRLIYFLLLFLNLYILFVKCPWGDFHHFWHFNRY